jgi:D-sedoheptulose 7-phosphate isomerase
MKWLNYVSKAHELMSELDSSYLEDMVVLLRSTLLEGRSIFICGNGGSNSTASHFACDLFNSLSMDDRYRHTAHNIYSLTDNVAKITAISNDHGYSRVFSFQIKNRIQKGDLLICLSCSACSENIIEVITEANKVNGTRIMLFTGNNQSQLHSQVDLLVKVETSSYRLIEDVHHMICHFIVEDLLENKQ